MANVNVRIDENLKKAAEDVFANIGLTSSAAINLFYKQVVRTRSIPFELVADEPNEVTMKAIEEGRKIVKDNKKGYDSISSLKNALDL